MVLLTFNNKWYAKRPATPAEMNNNIKQLIQQGVTHIDIINILPVKTKEISLTFEPMCTSIENKQALPVLQLN